MTCVRSCWAAGRLRQSAHVSVQECFVVMFDVLLKDLLEDEVFSQRVSLQ